MNISFKSSKLMFKDSTNPATSTAASTTKTAGGNYSFSATVDTHLFKHFIELQQSLRISIIF